MLGIALVDFRILKRWALVIMIGTVLLLLVVLVFGHDNLGARRQLFNNSVQPSEVAKLTIIIYIAYWLSSKGSRLKEVSYGLVPFAVLLGLVALLVVLQPDFDTTGLIVITALIMFFVAGADVKQLAIFALIATVTFVFAVMQIDYAAKRIQEFMSFLQDPLNGSAQMTAGLTALANGGLFGAGLGDGQNVVYLPFTDSIFAVVGEELGLVGTLGVVFLFLAFAYRGLRIALRSHDSFGLILGCGITAWIAIQAFVNIAVNTATIPVGGLTLPFISYGGSSLLATMAAVGVLLSISRYGARAPAGQPTEPVGAAALNGAFYATVGLRWRNGWSRLSHPGRSRHVKPTQRAGQHTSGSSYSSRSTGYNINTISTDRVDGLSRRVTRAKRTIARRTGATKRKTSSSTESSASHAVAEVSASAAAGGRSSDTEAGNIDDVYIGVAGAAEEELARRAGIPFQAIESGQVRGMAPWVAARNLLKAAKGSRQARSLMAEFRPDVVFVTGGYVAGPVVLAASRADVPVFIYLPDVEPGLAIQRMSRFARKVGVTFPEVARYFPGKAVVTGYPVRPEILALAGQKAWLANDWALVMRSRCCWCSAAAGALGASTRLWRPH